MPEGSNHQNNQNPTLQTLREQASDAISGIEAKATQAGRNAVGAVDQKREAVASAIDSAAIAIGKQAKEMPAQPVEEAAHKTAAALHGTAQYIRSHDSRSMAKDLTEVVRKYPGRVLVAGAALGFLFGYFSRRSD